MPPSPRRVLVLAYACEPDRGSEPGAGWEWAAAAATHHEVCLVTSALHAGPVREALSSTGAPPFADVHFLEEEVGPVGSWPGPGRSQVRYWRWQRAAEGFLRRLHHEHAFELAHHLTWAVDWQPTAVAGLPNVPFVWGPVGGTTATSLRLARWLGPRGLTADLAREAVTRPARRLVGDRIARQAALVLAQNDDVRRHFAPIAPTELAPNPAIRSPTAATRPDGRGHPPVAVFASRLAAWKGLGLAVAAVAGSQGWQLDVYGEGPDQARAHRLADRLGCAERVRFLGRRPREEVLAALARAQALLHPAIHDSSPWVVAEAVTLGTPVICLDRGGPPDLIRGVEGGTAVPADRRAPRALAAALGRLPTTRPVNWWRTERLPAQIQGHYRRALAHAGR